MPVESFGPVGQFHGGTPVVLSLAISLPEGVEQEEEDSEIPLH